MSRIGKQPIAIPSGVEVTEKDGLITVKASKGTLSFKVHPRMKVVVESGVITVNKTGEEIIDNSLHGLTRTLIDNMVIGVTKGFTKELEIQGVGYKVALKGKNLDFALGFSHPVEFKAPEGITFEIDKEKKNIIRVMGVSKEAVGQTAAKIRSLRPPEPYKGKGIRYLGEVVRKKAGKAAATAK